MLNTKRALKPKENDLGEKPKWDQRKMFGVKIKNEVEGQLLDPPIHYKCNGRMWGRTSSAPISALSFESG